MTNDVFMLNKSTATPKGWLAFELNVLRRLKFKSVALPFNGEPKLGAYLKRWDVRVLANDLTEAAWTKAVAEIQNNGERLLEEDAALVLEDVYVPGYRLKNSALRNWFGETDSWWFDNLRNNAEKLASPTARAIALGIGMGVGDYVLSFAEETRELRQPLSQVFKRLWSIRDAPFNNRQNNHCANKTDYDFTAENYTDLLFLRLPRARNLGLKQSMGFAAWREEWVRGTDDFWQTLDQAQAGRLGTHVETKFQYLHLVEEMLKTAAHIPVWAIAHTEDGFITTPDVVETINRVRRVETIFTKDFSELTGTKAVVITA